MYLSKNIHLLSFSIMATAFIRLGTSCLEGIYRFIMKRDDILSPDMLNDVLWRFQLACSIFKILAIAGVFLFTWRALTKYKNLVSNDDHFDMGKLQEEYLGTELSSLSVESIGQLIQIWATILIGAECVYTVSTIIYRRFTEKLAILALGRGRYDTFLSVYNLSHGFKYIEMLTAILLGFFMTGIFLKDKKIMVVTALITLAFMIAFGIVQVHTLSIPGRVIGIVWTSVIFHFTETVGLLLFSFYLSKNYRGL